MKIDLTAIDQEQFDVVSHVLDGGQVVFLVTPRRYKTLEEAQKLHAARWTPNTLIFRSSVWDVDGNPVSLSFRKFFNFGEGRAGLTQPTTLKGHTVVEKLDGSCFIVSKFQGNWILRTRGSINANTLDNGNELEIFKTTILPNIEHFFKNEDVSMLFEWTTPEQKIILQHEKPDWYLIGAVSHSDYRYYPQKTLDAIADEYGINRPKTYTFGDNIDGLLSHIEGLKGAEGVCVYTPNGQNIWKAKTKWYLSLHRMKEELGSFERVVDVWMNSCGSPTYQEAEVMVTEQFDYELWKMVQPDISRISDAWKDVQKIKAGMQKFVDETLKPLGNRRLQAEKTIAAYGQTNRAQYVFAMLDGKELDVESNKKLLWQCLKR